MARPLRIEYQGAIYHITSRGIDRREIFNNDKDREHLIQLLKEGADFYKVEVVAYCLMSNHFHLLLCTNQPNLSRFMQRMNVAYTRYFNHQYKRVGPLMQGRYKAILVGSEEYFKVLSRYIHLNPVKVKSIAKKSLSEQKLILKRYKWSSYHGILDKGKRSKYFSSEMVLESFGGDNIEGQKKYEEYVMEGISGVVANPMDGLKFQFLLGSEDFIKHIKNTFLKGKNLKPFTPENREIKQPLVAEIAEKVSVEYGISATEILEARSRHKEARKVLIELAYRLCLDRKSLKDLGLELGGISGPGIARVHERFQKTIQGDKDLSRRVSKVESLLCQ